MLIERKNSLYLHRFTPFQAHNIQSVFCAKYYQVTMYTKYERKKTLIFPILCKYLWNFDGYFFTAFQRYRLDALDLVWGYQTESP